MMPELKACNAPTSVKVSAPITHLCPFRDEVDRGTVLVSWEVDGSTVELHSLRTYFAGFADSKISHEELTARIYHELSTQLGIRVISVETHWNTAGMGVSVEVLRQSVNAQGA